MIPKVPTEWSGVKLERRSCDRNSIMQFIREREREKTRRTDHTPMQSKGSSSFNKVVMFIIRANSIQSISAETLGVCHREKAKKKTVFIRKSTHAATYAQEITKTKERSIADRRSSSNNTLQTQCPSAPLPTSGRFLCPLVSMQCALFPVHETSRNLGPSKSIKRKKESTPKKRKKRKKSERRKKKVSPRRPHMAGTVNKGDAQEDKARVQRKPWGASGQKEKLRVGRRSSEGKLNRS